MADIPIDKLAPLLPAGALWGLAAITAFATAWPSIHELSIAAIPWRRRYEREKMALELLKLRLRPAFSN
jgi:hypothetical protein